MLKFKEIREIDDMYDPEDVVLLEYVSFKDNKPIIHNNVVINSIDVLVAVCELGKDLLDLVLKNNSITYITKNNYDLEDIIEMLNNDDVTPIINKWMLENGLPYVKEDYDKVKTIVWHSILCFVFRALHKHITEFKSVESAKVHKKVPTKYKLQFYMSLVRDIFVFTLTPGRSQKYVGDLVSEIVTNDEMNNIVKDLKERRIESYAKYMSKDVLKLFDSAMISYILCEINNFNMTENFKLTRQIPIYNKDSKEIRFYNTATSLIGIAYNRLLINLTTTKWGNVRRECANPDCFNVFVKDGKNEFCNKCITDGTARKIIYQRYNAKRKKTNNP